MGCGSSKPHVIESSSNGDGFPGKFAVEQAAQRSEALTEKPASESLCVAGKKEDSAEASARCFAHHYLKCISAPRMMHASRLRRGGEAGANVPALDEGQADDGLKIGFPAGGLSALRRNDCQKELRGDAGLEVEGGLGGRERMEWWWFCWQSESGEVKVERQALASYYVAHFGKHPPRCRPALREMKARRLAEMEARNAKQASMAGQDEDNEAAGEIERWHVPTLKGHLQARHVEIESALKDQAQGVMRLEESATDDVTVVARVRPFLAGEGNDRGLVSMGETIQVESSELGNPGRQFSFDTVVGDEEGGSRLVFESTGLPAASEVARGVSAIVFAFGQTGSGKTYTLLGSKGQDGVQRESIASMSYEALTDALKQRAERESGSEEGKVEYTVECSILQVYLGGVYDLLGDDAEVQLRMRSHTQVKTLKEAGGERCELYPKETMLPCRGAKDFSDALEIGIGRRAVRGTKMNATSSRSHCIVTLHVKRKVRLEKAGGGGGGARGHMARLVLVDLAGNERDSARHGVDDEALLQAEGVDVNSSLTALSSVLRMRSRGEAVGGASRVSALTRLLKEPLTSAKIFFVACVSPTMKATITSAQTLGYATLVKKIKTNAEESAVLLEEGLDRFPIEFLPHTSLVQGGKISRSSEGSTVYLNELRAAVVKVFISHRWLSPSSNPLEAHPDSIGGGNPKFKLICGCIDRIVKAGWIRSNDMLEIVDWIDFACIDQDSHNPAEQLNGSMGRIIGSCDVMVTPVYDPDWKVWAQAGDDAKPVIDALSDYKALPFIEYLERGWCRLEMFFNANVPCDTRRSRLFNGKLRDVMAAERRRPHLIFGTRELELGIEPLILPKLEDAKFPLYHPGKGMLFNDNDRAVIGGYVEELFQINANLRGDPVVKEKPNVRVYVRCRPLNGRENDLNCENAVKFLDDVSCEIETERGVRTFAFNRVFREYSKQEQVFDEVKDIVGYAVDGRNACCFSYGEKGSGKTFTMFGPSQYSPFSDQESEQGIISRAMDELYTTIEARKMTDEIKVSISMLELYNDQLVDLLQDQTRCQKHDHKGDELDPQDEKKSVERGEEDKAEGVEIGKGKDASETVEVVEEKRGNVEPKSVRLKIKLDKSKSVVVEGAVNLPCASLEESRKCFEKGMENTQRYKSRTAARMVPPQSHLIFRVMVETVHKATGETGRGKLSFFDLAGYKRVSKVGATRETLKAAASVNQSLSALRDVIGALSDSEKFVPWRNSKLTHLLQDNFGGNSKTLMIANISPSDHSSDETLSTLRFAERAMLISSEIPASEQRPED